MTWFTPLTWSINLATTGDFNEQLRDNMEALKYPSFDEYTLNEAADLTVSAVNTWVTFGVPILQAALTTTGGDVVVHFHGSFEHSVPSWIDLDIQIDGTRHGGNDGLVRCRPTGAGSAGTVTGTFTRIVQDLKPGTHLFELAVKTGAATATLLAGAGTSTGRDVHGQLWARELT